MLNTIALKIKKSDAVSTEAGIDSLFTVDAISQHTQHRICTEYIYAAPMIAKM